MIYPKLKIRWVEGKGRCVVATEDIPKGTLLISDPVIVVSDEQHDHIEKTVVGRYTFEWDDENLAVVLGWGSLINHGLPENVDLISNMEKMTMDFHAIIDIKEGEELCYDYGHEEDELFNYYGIKLA